MENFDFSSQEKLPLMFCFKVKSKKYIFSTIIFNILLTSFVLFHISLFYNSPWQFAKTNLFIVELFNIIITMIFLLSYFRLSNFSKLEGKKLINFYFFYKIISILLFTGFLTGLIYSSFGIYLNKIEFARVTPFNIVFSFAPLLIVLAIKVTQIYHYYFAMKIIE